MRKSSRSIVKEVEYDSDEIKHHCHSDLDSTEEDPYFEYNKGNQYSFLEKKIVINGVKYEHLVMNQFDIK
jgi:hypothetical protein